MAKISDIINARSQDNVIPERVRAARDTTTGATDELYTNNVIEALGGDSNLPNWIKDVKTVKNPTIPVIGEIVKVIGLDDDEGAKQGKGRTAVDKFIEDFPKFQKDWKDAVEGDEKWGKRGWETVKSVWRQAVKDKAEEERKKAMYDAVNDGTVSGFITRGVFPRVTEHLANTGDYGAKDAALDVVENFAMAVPGAMWTGAPVKAASLIGKGMAWRGLGNTAASRVLANLPGHVTNLSNKIAASWGRNLPGTVAMGVGKTARNFAGNAVVPFAMEAADDIAYDEGEGMDERADFSVGDALTGAITNQVVNRGLARLGQGLIPEAAGSVEVRSPAVLKMRQILRSLGQSSHKSGDDFANSVRATASRPARPAGTYTAGEVGQFRNGAGAVDDGVLAITPEEKADASIASAVLDAIDNGDLKLLPKETVNDLNTIGKYADEFSLGREKKVAENNAKFVQQEIDKLSDAGRVNAGAIEAKENQLAGLSAEHDAGTIGDKEYKQQASKVIREIEELSNKGDVIANKISRLKQEGVTKMNTAVRNIAGQKENALYGKPEDYFNAGGMFKKLARFDNAGNYVEGIPYTRAEIVDELGKHMPEYVNYANWHGKPSVEPTRMQKIIGWSTDNPTIQERLLNDAKVAIPTWAVNKAGRAEMTKNLLKRIDATDEIKKDIEETHAAPGQRVRSKTAKAILDAGSGELSDKSRKYLAYLAEHPDAVKTGHSDPKERGDFNLWLLTEGRDLLEGTPLHRPTWEVK